MIDNDNTVDTVKSIAKTALLIIIVTFIMYLIMSASQENSRSTRNMRYISEGYCYDKTTQIIYIESYSSNGFGTVYTPYYDSNGNLYKYVTGNDEWIPVERKINEK